MSEHKLLPCPFCGSENVDIDKAYQDGHVTDAWIRCHCGAEMCKDDSIRSFPDFHVAAAWNQRATDRFIDELIDQLKKLKGKSL